MISTTLLFSSYIQPPPPAYSVSQIKGQVFLASSHFTCTCTKAISHNFLFPSFKIPFSFSTPAFLITPTHSKYYQQTFNLLVLWKESSFCKENLIVFCIFQKSPKPWFK